MPDSTFSIHINQFAEIIHHFICLKPRLKTVVSQDEEATRLIAGLMKTHPQGAAASLNDFDLLYNVSVILSQHHEPITMGELSQVLDVPLSTATRVVDWLVKNDFIERLADPDDRRVVRVALTKTGRAMYQAGNDLIRKRVELLLHPFTPSERENLLALLNKLVQALENET